MTDNKFTKSASVLLLAIPLVLPVGTITQAHEPVSNTSNVEVKLNSFTSNIVSVAGRQLNLKIVIKPEPQKVVAKPVEIRLVSYQHYLADPGPAGKRALAKKAAAAYGIDWKVLQAVWQVESGQSWYRSVRSYAGATGPCQFMPGTWRAYAVDGNGDGIKDVTYAPDCLFGAAKLLAANGAASGNVVGALLRYNHSMAYVNLVLSIARTY
ncbi:MAG: lytic transglycosylase domain-containing protein [Patescibacteria group bacterium]